MKEINKEDRPTCSCGRKMTITEFKGYYDSFKFFECGHCKIDPDDYDTEEGFTGEFG